MCDASTAAAGVEALLRADVVADTDPDKPTGCMIVLAATTRTPSTAGIRAFLVEQWRSATAAVRARLARARSTGTCRPARTSTR